MTLDSPRCGIYAIVGRPNVGKSTLLNHLVGQKISITSRKPQTTRYKIHGIAQHGAAQLVFADSPGWQRQPRSKLHKLMNQQIDNALHEVDAVLHVIDVAGWHTDDGAIELMIKETARPGILIINKIDRLATRDVLLPLIAKLQSEHAYSDYFPVCALQGTNMLALLELLAARAPQRSPLFAADDVTDRPERFMVAEFIREKIARQLGDELPYATHVVIDTFVTRGDVVHIDATIWVEKPGQKAIVIGRQGQRIKQIGSSARLDIEKMLEQRVYLKTWVKVRGKWTEDPAALEIFETPE